MRVALGWADVRAAVEDEPRVGLVGEQVDDLAVALRGGREHSSERVELNAGVDPPRRVVRRVHNDHARARRSVV